MASKAIKSRETRSGGFFLLIALNSTSSSGRCVCVVKTDLTVGEKWFVEIGLNNRACVRNTGVRAIFFFFFLLRWTIGRPKKKTCSPPRTSRESRARRRPRIIREFFADRITSTNEIK